MFSAFMRSPYRFLIAAAVLAAILCFFPAQGNAPQEEELPQTAREAEQGTGLPTGADLSERTEADCMLHKTLYYAPCGHSVQTRTALPTALVGLSRQALEAEVDGVLPGATVTGFSGDEVDVTVRTDIPCPLHWVLRGGEDGLLAVLQNCSGEALEQVRSTDVPLAQAPQEEQAALLDGIVFDDVQALEGYLESLSS